MSVYLTSIQINKVFHLEDILIELDPNEKKHLILTGKNGSGKTSLLIALVDFLQTIKSDPNLNILRLREILQHWDEEVRIGKMNNNPTAIHNAEISRNRFKEKLDSVFEKVELGFNDLEEPPSQLQNHDFVIAYYSATRKTHVSILNTPEKPNLNPSNNIRLSKIEEFLKFLVDLKIQEALARNENQGNAANEIKSWFVNFTELLQKIFEGDPVSLDFNYKDYSFTINQAGRKFGFNELSDGYSAVIDIVADLIIKMQEQNSLTRAYEKEGIVLIDEVETHLHLKLQRLILPMLTQIFPNIQFIVTTHSPFVLSSLDNAVAYDLEKQSRLEDLTEYSYEALAEGYFNVKTESSFLAAKLEKFETLSQMRKKDSAQLAEYQSLDEEFASMDDALAPPNIKGQYLQIKLNER
jgi:predicted ATP-binding protein involved in virulence